MRHLSNSSRLVVELKRDMIVRGTLESVDADMGLTLTDVVFENLEVGGRHLGQTFCKMSIRRTWQLAPADAKYGSRQPEPLMLRSCNCTTACSTAS